MTIEDIISSFVGIVMLFVMRLAYVSFTGSGIEEQISSGPPRISQENDADAFRSGYDNEDKIYYNDELKIIKQIADSVGYPWADFGGRFHFGCPDESNCYCGSTCLLGEIRWSNTSQTFDIWITENAFQDEKILKFTIFHEMAHLWQANSRANNDSYEDFARWDFGRVDPVEATADCLASAWGGEGYIYYDCPLEAQRYIHQLYLESLR